FLVQEHRSGAAVNLDKSHFDVMLDPGNNRHPEFKHGSMAEERHSGRSYLSTAIGEEGDVLCKNFFQFFLVASFTGFQEGFHKALLLIVIRLEARPRALDFFPRSMEDLPGVIFRKVAQVCYLTVGVVKCLTKYKHCPLDGIKLLQQRKNCDWQQVLRMLLLGRRLTHYRYGQPRALIQFPLLLRRFKPVDRFIDHYPAQISLGVLNVTPFFVPSFKRILYDIFRLLDITQDIISERYQEGPVLMNAFVHRHKLSIQQ